MKSFIGLFLALVSLTAYAEDAGGPFTFSVGAEFRYDDNIGLAPDPDSERDDLSSRVKFSVAWLNQTATRDVSLTLSPYYEGVNDLQDLSNYGVELDASWRQQFSPDISAFYVRVDLGGEWLEYEDSEPRDGYKTEAAIAFGKRFGPRFGAEVGYRYQYRESTDDFPEGTLFDPVNPANSDEVFDQQRDGPFVKLEFLAATKTTLFFEYSHLEGDVAATGSILAFDNGQNFDRLRDFAFDEGVNFLAWRVDAEQDIYAAGVNHGFTDALSASLTASFLDATAEGGNDYENTIVTVGLVWLF